MVAFISVWATFRLLILTAVIALLSGQTAYAGRGERGACERWPENRLVIGDLQARHFSLDPGGDVELMPPLDAAGKRSIFHRTFGLSLDIAEPIAIFYTTAPKTCVIARDRERSTPQKIPVFFVGRERQSLDDLKADAELAAFAPSAFLHDGDNFSEIEFHLRRGSSRFDDIRPFFVCGLAGVMLCEGECPGDSALLAASLVNWVVSADKWPPQAGAGASGR